MVCPNCGSLHTASDNFCRHCGWNLRGANVPMVIEQKHVPALYHAERALVVGGATTIALSVAVWIARRWLLPHLADALARRLPLEAGKPRLPAPHAMQAEDASQAQIESFIWLRRITFRR